MHGVGNSMTSDRAFAIYAFGLIAGIFSLITATVLIGISAAPSLDFVVEHVGMGLLVRGSYKSFDGSNWIRDFLEYTGMIVGASDEAEAFPGGLANAA